MINATNVVIQNATGDIVGQMEMTMSFNGTTIDVTNKSFDDWVVLMDGEVGIKQLQISGSIVYNDDDQYRKVREDAFNGNLDTYTISYVSNTVIGEIFTATMMPNALSDSFPHGDKLTTSITFLSSGPVLFTPVHALVTDIYPILAREETVKGNVSVESIDQISIIFETPLMKGTVAVEEITQVKVIFPVPYTESEEPVEGSLLVTEITQVKVIFPVPYAETEEPMTGASSVIEITQVEILVTPIPTEEEAVKGDTSIVEITQITV